MCQFKLETKLGLLYYKSEYISSDWVIWPSLISIKDWKCATFKTIPIHKILLVLLNKYAYLCFIIYQFCYFTKSHQSCSVFVKYVQTLNGVRKYLCHRIRLAIWRYMISSIISTLSRNLQKIISLNMHCDNNFW